MKYVLSVEDVIIWLVKMGVIFPAPLLRSRTPRCIRSALLLLNLFELPLELIPEQINYSFPIDQLRGNIEWALLTLLITLPIKKAGNTFVRNGGFIDLGMALHI